MDKLRFGIAGTGKFSHYHAETIRGIPDIELRSIFSGSKNRANDMSKKYDCRPFDNFEDFLESVDVVVISNKNSDHAPLAKIAIKKQKHVIIEKPFAISKKEMDEVLKLSKENNVKVISFLEYRFAPVYKKIKKLLKNKDTGKVLSVHLELFQNKPLVGWKSKKKSGGGLLLMYLIHHLDILCFLFKESPLKIHSSLKFSYEVESTANMMLEYKDFDVTINSSCIPIYEKQEKIIINTERKTFTILDHRILIEEFVDNSKPRRIFRRVLGIAGISLKKIRYFDSVKFCDIYTNFIKSVRENKKPYSSIEQSSKSMGLIFKIKENPSKK